MQKRDFLKNYAVQNYILYLLWNRTQGTIKRKWKKDNEKIKYGLYWRPIGSRTWALQRTHHWTPKI